MTFSGVWHYGEMMSVNSTLEMFSEMMSVNSTIEVFIVR